MQNQCQESGQLLAPICVYCFKSWRLSGSVGSSDAEDTFESERGTQGPGGGEWVAMFSDTC